MKDLTRLRSTNCLGLFGFIAALAVLLIQGCSMNSGFPDANLPNRSNALGDTATPRAITPNVHVGAASWYGPGFNGKKTASGEIFDESKFTAAHKTLPLGSKAKVTHLSNGKSVEVLVNDRGPYINGRMIDLSHAAARALGMIHNGIAEVQVELVQEVTTENALIIGPQ